MEIDMESPWKAVKVLFIVHVWIEYQRILKNGSESLSEATDNRLIQVAAAEATIEQHRKSSQRYQTSSKVFTEQTSTSLSSFYRSAKEVGSEHYSRFVTLEDDERPFAHPYYWATFIFSGV
jgi:hypothetical protein